MAESFGDVHCMDRIGRARADLERNVLIFGAGDRSRLKLNAGGKLSAGKRVGDYVINHQ